MNWLLEKCNAIINVLTLSAILERGSAPLPFKIWQDARLLSRGHTGLVTTNSTQGIPILILSSVPAPLRGRGGGGKPEKGRQIQMPRRSTELQQSLCHHRMLFTKKKGQGANKENACKLHLHLRKKKKKKKHMKENTLPIPFH